MGPQWFAGGVNSAWVQVTPTAFGPGHGLWSLNDLDQALAIAAANPSDPRLLGTYSGIVGNINYADDLYNDAYANTNWGVYGILPPLFAPGDGKDQDDWGVRFNGLIDIQAQGWYNFGVLSDDAFVFVLSTGTNNYQISQDGLNPRDRYGLPENLFLDPGQYAFTLDAFEHLGAGVVSLGVWHDAEPVPEPAGVALVVMGLAGIGVVAWRNRYC